MWEAEVGFADFYTEAVVRKHVSRRITFEAELLARSRSGFEYAQPTETDIWGQEYQRVSRGFFSFL
jgi:hypothetical protein